MSIFIVRHGETDWNREGIYQGQMDTPLNEKGRDDARKLAVALSKIRFSYIYTSDLKRAKETSEIINEYLNVPTFYKRELREMDFGRWTGISVFDMERIDPDLFKRWRDNPWDVSPPDGETFKDLTERVVKTIEDIFHKHRDENILVVSHGGPIKAIILWLLHGSPRSYWNIEISHRSIVLLEKDIDYRISVFNIQDIPLQELKP